MENEIENEDIECKNCGSVNMDVEEMPCCGEFICWEMCLCEEPASCPICKKLIRVELKHPITEASYVELVPEKNKKRFKNVPEMVDYLEGPEKGKRFRDRVAERLREQIIRDVEVIKKAYRKHVLNDESIGWSELGDELRDVLCEDLTDVGFQAWLEECRNEKNKKNN